MAIEHAFWNFNNRAAARGVDVESEGGGPDALIGSARRHGGELRLVWEGRTSTLTLDISHGPPSGSATGWICLYRARYTGGQLQADQRDVSVDDAIEYGLDLLGAEPL